MQIVGLCHAICLWLALAVICHSAGAQSSPEAPRTRFDAEVNTILQLLELEQIERGLTIAKQLHNKARQQFGPSSAEYVRSLDVLAECHKKAGALDQAALALGEALEVVARKFANDNSIVIGRRIELAEILAIIGDYRGSAQSYEAGLAGMRILRGAAHPAVARYVHDLALVLHKAGDVAAAEGLMQESLKIFEGQKPRNELVLSKVETDLAIIYLSGGKLEEAERLLLGALNILDDPSQEVVPQVEKTLRALVEVYRRTGREESARKSEDRADAHRPERIEKGISELDALWSDLGNLSQSPAAIPVAQKIVNLTEQIFGPHRFRTGVAINNLGQIYSQIGRYREAELNLKRAVSIFDRIVDRDSFINWGPNLASSLNNLGLLYINTDRYVEALPLLDRSHLMDLVFSGESSQHAAVSENNIGLAHELMGQTKDAEQAYRRALAIDEIASGPESWQVGLRLSNLASLLMSAGNHEDAIPLIGRARGIAVKLAGEDYIGVAAIDGQVAKTIAARGRLKEAQAIYEKAIIAVEAFRRKDANRLISEFGIDGTMMGLQKGLGDVHVEQSQWVEAFRVLDAAVKLAIGQVEGRASALQELNSGLLAHRAIKVRQIFEAFVNAAARLRLEDPSRDAELTAVSFEIAQWVRGSTAAAALAEMATRGATEPGLESIIRELQDLIGERRAISAYMDSAIVNRTISRDVAKELQLSTRGVETDARIAVIKKILIDKFPKLDVLTKFTPLTIAEVRQAQNGLSEDEALVLFLGTPAANSMPELMFIWVVTKTGVRWIQSKLGSEALNHEVALLRCGLEPTLMNPDYFPTVAETDSPDLKAQKTAARERMAFCFDHFTEPQQQDIGGHKARLGPFDLERAHRLYKALFGEVEDLIKGKDLLIVPFGPLTQLPFQVLITKKPDAGVTGPETMRKAAWLVRDHAITILPVVSSLKALREHAKTSKAERAYIGFGNPLLEGREADRGAAATARRITTCDQAGSVQTPAIEGALLSPRPLAQSGGLTNVAEIRDQAPLPSTAEQLCNVARSHDAIADVHLGARATEAAIKGMGASLAQYRIVHFATHGALAGELKGTSEPGLILTPPDQATETNDGYLSASEVVGLKLDADWVVLSACNTAAGGAQNAEAMSGLARAFFYAGTRSLLVSHWAVYAQSTSRLIASAVGTGRGQGRAKALQLAMLEMIDEGPHLWVHPTYWAPFVLVGEGARGR